MYINKAMVYGNLTRDPEVKSLPSGMQVCSFSLATNRVYKDKDGKKQESTDYHNIAVFGRQAETCGQYLKKGAGAFVEGRLQTRSWDKDGVKQYRTEIVADRVQFGPRGGAGTQHHLPLVYPCGAYHHHVPQQRRPGLSDRQWLAGRKRWGV